MKKYLILASAAILALASCAKEQSIPTPVKEETILLNFVSERPQLASETTPSNAPTKTEWSTNKIVWSTGDKIRVGYKKDGSWMGQSAPGTAKFYKSDEVTIDGGNASVGTFSVPISGSAFSDPAVSGTYQFFAVCPGDAISGTEVADPTAKNITLPATQTPGSNTFDPTADILVGQTEGLSISGLPTDPIELSWTRLVAHADLTFSNLAYSGSESVSKITLTFNTEAKVAGSFAVNIPAATAGEGSTNILVLSGSNITSGADYAKAWACVLPVTFTSLSVELKTDKAVYTRNITGISKTFKKNARNTLEINMSTATRTPITELVADGNYVIAALNSTTYYAISSDANGDRRDRVEITTVGFDPEDYSKVSPYTAANKLVWTVTNVAGGIKISQATDPSSYMAYRSNGINLNSTGSVITVENGSADGLYKLYNTSYMQMNGTSGFGFYSSNVGTKDFYFVPATGTPTLTFPVKSKTVDAETTFVEFTYTTAFLSDAPVVTITSDSGSAVADTDMSAGTLTVTLNENTTPSDKSVTLSVSATGATPVVLTITQAGAVGDASNGDTLWAEAFSGFSADDVPDVSNASTTVYGSKTVTYSCVNGDTDTKVYTTQLSSGGADSPELLISKSNGSFTVSGIPTGNATEMTLSFKSNKGCAVSTNTTGATIGSNIGAGNTYTYSITVTAGTKYVNISFTNSDAKNNTRVDDFTLVVGAPVPGITVATSEATATESATGMTATLNGTLTLLNGAVNASVTEAGFYYKLSSDGGYTKVTCASAPTSTTSFTFNLTGLTKGSEYTYYAYAVYDGGSEVVGLTKTFTPTQTASGTKETITSGTFSGNTSSISMTTASGVTITQLKDDGTNVNTSYNTVSTLRVYRANKMQFTGKTFTRIEMVYTGSYSGADWTVSVGGGTVSIDTENNKVVWVNNSGASTVTLKNSTASGTNTQLRTSQFVVTYN